MPSLSPSKPWVRCWRSKEPPHDLVIAGGGALMLSGVIDRSTADLDAIGRVTADGITEAEFPPDLARAISDIGQAMGLAGQGPHAWLKGGPSFLLRKLPEGYRRRWSERRYGALTIRILSPFDLVHLKLLAATAPDRLAKRADDIQDLRALDPGPDDLRAAVRWCARLDGREDFVETDLRPILVALGRESVLDDV